MAGVMSVALISHIGRVHVDSDADPIRLGVPGNVVFRLEFLRHRSSSSVYHSPRHHPGKNGMRQQPVRDPPKDRSQNCDPDRSGFMTGIEYFAR